MTAIADPEAPSDGHRTPALVAALMVREIMWDKMSISKIRELDLLSYQEKVKHWDSEPDPWKPSVGLYRFNNKRPDGFGVSYVGGNITRQPLLFGRPCFGIIPAFFLYKDSVKFLTGRGLQPDSRCSRCSFRTDCEKVVRRRMLHAPGVEKAFREWLAAEGPESLRHPGWRQTRAGRLWKNLVRLVVEAPFTSVNDEAVAEHYRHADEGAREKDRKRKRTLRQTELVHGKLDDNHLEDLRAAAVARTKRIVEAVLEAHELGRPPYLAKIKKESVRELHDVWLGRETLRASRKNFSGAAIARWIVAEGFQNRSSSQAALTTRVARDLKRINQFEERIWQGEPLILPFDPSHEFRQ